MSDVVTLSKSSPQFESYLLGTFSKEKRALPIRTLNANSLQETVTFEIKPLSEIGKPSLPTLLLNLLKVRTLILVLFPMYLILVKNTADKTLRDPFVVLLSTLGILCAYIAVNLRNDFMDHMKGLDRINPKAGSRVIQRGWMTAQQVKNWSNLFVSLALALAAVVILVFPAVISVVLLTFSVGVWAQFLKKGSFKYQKGGELFVFLLLGPLLTTGYQISITGSWDLESLFLGCMWGWLVVFLQHIKNFEFIMINSQAGFHNTVTWLGFDKAKTLLKVWWLSFLGMFISYHFRYAGSFWTWFLGATLAFSAFPFFMSINYLQSPAGSDLIRVRRRGYNLVLMTIFLWTLENIWYWARWRAWGV
ncbi:MAG: UbiA family prenyltransferase [Pseudobdellovibrionaceae bacterium]